MHNDVIIILFILVNLDYISTLILACNMTAVKAFARVSHTIHTYAQTYCNRIQKSCVNNN